MPAASGDLLLESIRQRLERVRERIEGACARVGRSSDEITLIAVTKTYSPIVVEAAVAAGLTDFGENRVQELITKSDAAPGEVLGGAIRWHLIGPLQRNKAREAARCADYFHALDSLRLAEALDSRGEASGRIIPCMVQVNISAEATKSGVIPHALPDLLEGLAAFPHLSICGLMTMAAPAQTARELETVVRPQFRRLRMLADGNDSVRLNGDLRQLSMGMSGDFEVAIEEGATHIRLGSVLFGARSE